jgi:hypothetical protein
MLKVNAFYLLKMFNSVHAGKCYGSDILRYISINETHLFSYPSELYQIGLQTIYSWL